MHGLSLVSDKEQRVRSIRLRKVLRGEKRQFWLLSNNVHREIALPILIIDDDDVPRYDDVMVEPNQSLAAHFLTNLGQSLPWRRRWLIPSDASSTDDTLVMSEKSSSHSLIKTKNLITARSVPEYSSNSVLDETNAPPRSEH
jgi:hypothetical protein